MCFKCVGNVADGLDHRWGFFLNFSLGEKSLWPQGSTGF